MQDKITPIDVYYAPTPNGWKISIFCEEAGLPYNIIPVNLGRGDQFKPDFLKISPNNRMPAIVDKNFDPPISVFESGAIMQYLGETYREFFPKLETLYPRLPRNRTQVAEWLFWVNANLGPMAGQVSHFSYYAPAIAKNKDHSYSKSRYTKEYDRLIGVMERQLSSMGTKFLCGDEVTAADCAAWPWVKPWKRWMGNDFENYPRVRKWYNTCKVRPGFVKGREVMKDRARAQQKIRETKSIPKSAADQLFGQKGKSKL